jgi:hypothetical protein
LPLSQRTSYRTCKSQSGEKESVDKASMHQGCHNGRPMVKITVRTTPASAFTPRTRFYPLTGFYRLRTRKCVHADARLHPCGPPPSRADAVYCPRRWDASVPTQTLKKKNLFFFFFGSCCQLEKREKFFRFSVFNPQAPQAPPASRAPRAS